jgi:dipeptidyl aminopeptidase/acylaminoacyl peptidase
VLTNAPDGQRTLSVTAPGGSTPVLTFNAAYAGVTPPQVVPIRHAGPGGEPLTSWLYLPADRPKGKLPLVIIPYRGHVFPKPPAHLALGAWNESANAQILVGAGYAVLAPSLPYASEIGEPAKGVAADILRAVDAALARGDLDPDRIALFGHSFGGLTVVNAAIQSPRFKTVIASAGLYDLVANWGIFPQHQAGVPQDGYAPNLVNGITEHAQTSMGAPPWADPQRYLRNSAIFQADQITAPVLILHGEADELGDFHAQELFSALYRQGKDAELVTWWGEGHNFASPANIADRYAIILDWLRKTLPPAVASTATKPRP